MDNPFRNLTKEEKEKQEAVKREGQAKLKKAAEDAKSCLNSTVFAKYKESAHEAREALIKMMKANDDPDPLRFAFFAKACLSKIDVFDMMIEDIEKDAKKI